MVGERAAIESAGVYGLRDGVTQPLKRFYFSATSAAVYTTYIRSNVSFLLADFYSSWFREDGERVGGRKNVY